jgi:hypothetical protein
MVSVSNWILFKRLQLLLLLLQREQEKSLIDSGYTSVAQLKYIPTVLLRLPILLLMPPLHHWHFISLLCVVVATIAAISFATPPMSSPTQFEQSFPEWAIEGEGNLAWLLSVEETTIKCIYWNMTERRERGLWIQMDDRDWKLSNFGWTISFPMRGR